MLLVVIEVGTQLVGLPAHTVSAVLPSVPLVPLEEAGPQVAGALLYRGRSLPIIDLGVALGHVPTPPTLGARIVLLEAAGEAAWGLLVPRVVDTVTVDEDEAMTLGLALVPLRWRGALHAAGDRAIQVVQATALLSEDLQQALAGVVPR